MIRGSAGTIIEIGNNVAELAEVNKIEKMDKINPQYTLINRSYVKYLLAKINFHRTNPVIPSTIQTNLTAILLDAEYKADKL